MIQADTETDLIQKVKAGAHKCCSYGLCKSGSRSKAYKEGYFYFISFPKPCLKFRKGEVKSRKIKQHFKLCEKCEKSNKWVTLCGRKDKKFRSISNVTKDTYICSLHFFGESGPSEEYPDPKPCQEKITVQKQSKPRKSLKEKYQHGSELEVTEKDCAAPLMSTDSTTTADVEFQEVISFSNKYTDFCEEKIQLVEAERKMLEKETQTLPKRLVSKKTQTVSKKVIETTKKMHSVDTQTSDNLMDSYFNDKLQNVYCSNCTDGTLKKSSSTPVKKFVASLEKNDAQCIFYTGLHFKQILILMTFLGNVVNNLKYWGSNRKTNTENQGQRKLTSFEELILVLTRLRCGFLVEDLSFRFELSVGLLSSITTTWIQCLYQHFSTNLKSRMFADRNQVAKSMPKNFKTFKNLRIIIDCTEFFCEAPSNFEHQGNLYSHYKGHTTFKVLLGCTPNGEISFISEVYEGAISDREIVIKSKFVDYLHPGDLVLADRGFTVHDVVESVGATLNIPPFLRSRNRFCAQEEIATKKIAKERIYVEHAVGRLKQFRILKRTIPLNMRNLMSQIVFVCACLVNFQDPIVYDE